MGAVPHRHDAAALFLRPPVHHGASARRPPHSLEPAAEEQQHEHDGNAGGCPWHKAHKQHHRCRQDQTGRQEHARIRAIRHGTHDEFGKTVGDGYPRQREPQIAAGEALLYQIRHGEREVFTYKVVRRIPEEDPQEDLPTQTAIERIYFCLWQTRPVGRRFEDTEHNSLRGLEMNEQVART